MKNYSGIINKAVATLNNSGVIVCPTDTIIGLSADATNTEAVNKIINIKNRLENKSFIVLVNSIAMLQQYIEKEIPQFVLNFLEQQTEPTTIIYPQGKNLAKNVLAANGSIGIRIVKNGTVAQIINKLKKPIVSTSVNESGKEAITNTNLLPVEIASKVDYVMAHHTTTHSKSSAIYVINNNELLRIR